VKAEDMKQHGNILGGKVEEIKGKLNERSADAHLKKISDEESKTTKPANVAP
jgi:hypothetical protein